MAVKYFDVKEKRYKVKKYKEDKKLKMGNAYIVGKYVIPYKGEYKYKDDCIKKGVGIYDCKETDGIIIIKPFGKRLSQMYSKSNAYELDPNYMKKVIMESNISSDLDDKVLELDSGDIFLPEIEDTDNICQMVIKAILQKKKIDLKQYTNRFDSPTTMGNWKRALLKHGMGTDRFIEWLDLLDVDYDIVLKDKPYCTNPMGEEFHSKDLK